MKYVLMKSVLCLRDPQAVFCPFRAGVNCCVYVQIEIVSVHNTVPLASWFVYNHIFSHQGPDDASAMGPSELILTRGTLNEEEEERESDTDDIDHEVTEESHEEPAFRNFMQDMRKKCQRKSNLNE